MIGKKVKVKGKLICIDNKFATPKALLHNVEVDGEPFRDHTWVDIANVEDCLKTGEVIEGTAFLVEYLGLDGDKQVKKIGLKLLRSKR
jgi:hypothetical protein